MGAREDQIARIQQLERIKALETQQGVVGPEDKAWTPSNAQDPTTKSLIDTGKTALGGTLKALDYQRGATTGPLIAQGLDLLPGGNPVYRPEEAEAQRHFKQNYPTPVQLLERKYGELPSGPRLSDAFPSVKGKWYDASTKGALDALASAVTDPATYESRGLSLAAKGGAGVLPDLARAVGLAHETGLTRAGKVARAVANPLEAGLAAGSRGNYAKAFEPVDRLGADLKKPEMVSDLLREQGFHGDMDQAQAAVQAMNKAAGSRIGSVVGQATKEGATVPAAQAFGPALTEMDHLRSLGNADASAAADAISKQLADLVNTHGWEIPIEKAQDLKSFLDNPVYAASTRAANGAEAQGAKAMANATVTKDVLAPGVEQAVPAALKPEFKAAKARYASTDPDIVEALRQASNKAKELRGAFGVSDFAAMGAGGVAGNLAGSLLGHGDIGGALGFLGPLAFKQGKQAWQSTAARTGRGALQEALGPGTSGLLDTAARRGTWSLLNQEDKK